MNSKIASIFFLSLLACNQINKEHQRPGPNRDYQNNRYTYNLKGKVKSIKEVNYQQWVTEDLLSNYITKQFFEFDTTGNAIRVITFLQEEAFHTDLRYTYDAAGNYIIKDSFEENGKQDRHTTYAFDAQGRLTDEQFYMGEKEMLHTVNEYKATTDGYIEREVNNTEADYFDIVKYTFSKDQRRSTVEYFDKLSNPYNRKSEYLLDAQGNILENRDYSAGEYLNHIQSFTYNQNNQWIFKKWQSDTPKESFLNSEKFRTFDEHGNETEYKDVYSSGIKENSYRTVYTYDQQGNWIRKETFMWDGARRTAIDRKIEYY